MEIKRSFFSRSSNFEQKRQKLSDQAMSSRARVRNLSSGGKCLRVCEAVSVKCDGEGKWRSGDFGQLSRCTRCMNKLNRSKGNFIQIMYVKYGNKSIFLNSVYNALFSSSITIFDSSARAVTCSVCFLINIDSERKNKLTLLVKNCCLQGLLKSLDC